MYVYEILVNDFYTGFSVLTESINNIWCDQHRTDYPIFIFTLWNTNNICFVFLICKYLFKISLFD